MDKVSSNIVKNDFKEEKARRKDKLDHICDLVDLEWNASITREELVNRLTALCKKERAAIEVNEVKYRCAYDSCTDKKDAYYYLESLQFGQDDWVQVSDLTDLRVWEYNQLVDEIQKHYPDYLIEHLEGRFV